MIRVDEEGIANGGKHDNLTVALIETNSNSILKEKMSTKIRNILFALIFICCVSIAGNIIQAFICRVKRWLPPRVKSWI